MRRKRDRCPLGPVLSAMVDTSVPSVKLAAVMGFITGSEVWYQTKKYTVKWQDFESLKVCKENIHGLERLKTLYRVVTEGFVEKMGDCEKVSIRSFYLIYRQI